jgi:hypothetical protein
MQKFAHPQHSGPSDYGVKPISLSSGVLILLKKTLGWWILAGLFFGFDIDNSFFWIRMQQIFFFAL